LSAKEKETNVDAEILVGIRTSLSGLQKKDLSTKLVISLNNANIAV